MIDIKIKHKILTSEGLRVLDIDEQFSEDSFVLVKGDSGIGKTTFFRILAGLITPDFGWIKRDQTILLDTENNISISPQRRDISFMFQNFALFPNMTVKENITFAQKEKSDNVVNDIMEKFALNVFEKTSPAKLSGGQQQRVALARTLVQESKMMLLDEPFSAVDSNIKKAMIKEIIEVQKRNQSTCFIISHNEVDLNSISYQSLFIE